MSSRVINNKVEVNVSPAYAIAGVLYIKNGCCHDRPVLLTTNDRPDGTTNYSCQCACGGWCTTGMDTPDGAIEHYRRMSDGENLYGGIFGLHY